MGYGTMARGDLGGCRVNKKNPYLGSKKKWTGDQGRGSIIKFRLCKMPDGPRKRRTCGGSRRKQKGKSASGRRWFAGQNEPRTAASRGFNEGPRRQETHIDRQLGENAHQGGKMNLIKIGIVRGL